MDEPLMEQCVIRAQNGCDTHGRYDPIKFCEHFDSAVAVFCGSCRHLVPIRFFLYCQAAGIYK